jgi:hypothetical protein
LFDCAGGAAMAGKAIAGSMTIMRSVFRRGMKSRTAGIFFIIIWD